MTDTAAAPLSPAQAAMDANRRRWDARARIHAADRTGFYGVEDVLAGRRGLDGIAAEELGDLTGLRVAHLQCHFGLDTLILAQMGAQAEGLDFSPVAIETARELAARAGVSARFHLGDVTQASSLMAPGAFDLVFVSWGAVCWLPDIFAWAREAAALLRPGGRLFFRDGHPFAQSLDPAGDRLAVFYDWRTPRDAPLAFEEGQTYTGDDDPLPEEPDHEWIHPVSDLIEALLAAGMRLDGIEEHDYLVWEMWPGMMRQGESGEWRLPPEAPKVPLALTLRATRLG